jgi:hypothetical protein
MSTDLSVSDSTNALIGTRKRADYNDAERWFSCILRDRLHELLQAKRNRLQILRRYPREPGRIGVMSTPPGLPRDQLRLHVVEDLIWQTLDFVRCDDGVGPVAQFRSPSEGIVEVQTFPTKYPHIVIERVDRFRKGDSEPSEISLSLLRVQNQRHQTQLNRVLDAASLVLDLIRTVR